jgi:adenine-specific DNA-methyltransferase
MIYNESCFDTMAGLKSGSIDLIITSPPYNLGKEYEKKQPLIDFINSLLPFIDEAYRLLSDNGSICFQVGNYVDSGSVYPLDCLLFIPFLNAGFIPRNRIVWHFGHGLHCKKRFSGRHETILWFTKSSQYIFNLDPVRVPSKYPNKKHFKGAKKGQISGNPLGKNPSDVWDIVNVKNNHPEKTAHPCQFPEELVKRLVLSLTDDGATVYDPFGGSGTVIKVCEEYGRNGLMSETDKSYCEIALERIGIYA